MIKYIPERGDIVWLDFDPSKGSEQRGHRPAVILSKSAFNVFGICYVAPIKSKIKNYNIEVALENTGQIDGVVLTNQVTALDWRKRNCEYVEKIDIEILNRVSEILKVLLSL